MKEELLSLLKQINVFAGVWSISNSTPENLNRKDKAFLEINKRVSKAIKLINKEL